MKILIAEDDKSTRAVYERILTKLDYDVVAVSDGEQAWEILQQKTFPEIVILDWEMPRMDGIEVCERIRQAGFERYTYIIIATAKSRTQDVITGLQAGADDFLIKPIYPMVLRARLLIAERILDLERQYLIKIEELQSLLARHNILADVTSKQMIKDTEAKAAERVDTDSERGVDEQHIEIARILKVIDSNYSRVPIKIALERAKETKRIVWSPLVVPSETTWFDLILWIADEAESLITKSLLNQTFTKQNALIADACAESLGLVSQAMVTTLEKDNREVVVPILPMTTMAQQLSIEQETLSESTISCFSLFEGKAVMMVIECKAEEQRTPQTLEVGDVLRSDVFATDVRKRVLLREYTAINGRHIAVLQKSMGKQDIQIPVVPPSKTAQRFLSFRDEGP